jgi:SpoVK/Ycf46/Vps4 family AAA+-type ATPase
MTTGKLLRKILKAGVEGDKDQFEQVSEEIIRHERQKQHHLLANDLERILYGTSATQSSTVRDIQNAVPKDAEGDLPLAEIKEPVRDLEDVVLSDRNRELLERILREKRRVDTLSSYGLRPVEKILFCGPPGCGKSLTAEIVATEVSLPLAVVRLDSIISSYLGATAANLRKVFDFIEDWPVVAFFDEFDALAKTRSDQMEHGELRRVVNAFLQMLDEYRGDSVVIAATNYEKSLDQAIWRRFEELLVFELPGAQELRALLQLKLRGARREFEIEEVPVREWFLGMSYADVERIVLRAIKSVALENKEFVTLRMLEQARKREKLRQKRIELISE